MSKIAVIDLKGHQFLVKQGDILFVEKIAGNEGETVKFDTLMTADDAGSITELGTPTTKTQVSAKVLKQLRDPKIEIYKFKSKTRYRRHQGHRQHKTKIEITSL